MGKEKKAINILTVFFISHKSDVKTFFNQILNQCPKGTRQHFPKTYWKMLETQIFLQTTDVASIYQ